MGDPYKSLHIIIHPYTSLQSLTHPQRGEGTDARKYGHFQEHPKSCFLILFLLNMFFLDHDDHYTNDLPLHTNHPSLPNKSGSFSTNN